MRKLFLNSLVLFDTAGEAKEYVYQNKKDIISKNTVDIIQIKIEDESHYHFGRKSIIHIKNYNEDINEYDMEIDGIDLYYNNNIIGQLGTTKDHKYNGEVALVSNLSKRFIQSVMHYLYSTLRGVKWEKPTILSSPIEDKYFGYNPNDIYTDDIDVVYGSKTIGYCGTKNRNFTGEIRFKDGVNENLKKAVLYKFNNSSLYNDVEWKEVEKMKESIESKLAENFANELKNLQKEGLFENVSSFDLSFKGNKLNIKLNESQPGNRNVSFKKRSNLKENESDEVTYAQDFLGEDIDISELKEAAAEAGISLEIYEGSGNNGCDEIYVTASSEEALKEFLYDWWLIENDDDFEAGLLD